MSVSRSQRYSRPIPIWPKMAPSWFQSRPMSWRRYWTPARFPAAFAPGLSTEALVLRAGYGDVEAAFAAAHADRRPRPDNRPAQRRTDRDARRARPLRRRRRRAGIVRCGQGTAPQPRRAGAHVRPQHNSRGAEGRQYRRRVRRARRALPRRFSRLPCRDAIGAAGQMDRGPTRASDGRQSFARAAPPRPRCIRRRGPDPGPRGRYSTSTRAPMCAPMAPGLRR